MSQPVLTATLALAVAVIFTAAVAIVTLAAETLSRAVKLIGVVAVSAFAVVGLQQANLRMNFTGSMPIGIYALSRLPPGGVKRGMFVVACAPIRAAKIGQRRGYLAAGPCADNTELLLKTVAATPSDEVDVTSAGAAVNGCLLPHSRPLSLDAAGRRLLSLTHGNYRLRPAQVWLYAPNDRSWDSRYWGPASTADVRARAVPLLTAPLPSFLRVAGRARWRTPLERFMESLRPWGLNSHVSNHGRPALSSRYGNLVVRREHSGISDSPRVQRILDAKRCGGAYFTWTKVQIVRLGAKVESTQSS
jgi:conjugative transfer signal peptidase TraF